MFHGSFPRNNNKFYLQKKSYENLALCKSLGFSNLPIKGENRLDITENGEHILASNKSTLCFINTRSHLYNPLIPQSLSLLLRLSLGQSNVLLYE